MDEHAADPIDSNLPEPYGVESVGGRRAALYAHSVTPSESRSEAECPASAIMEGDAAA
jgi:hypothetical protein